MNKTRLHRQEEKHISLFTTARSCFHTCLVTRASFTGDVRLQSIPQLYKHQHVPTDPSS